MSRKDRGCRMCAGQGFYRIPYVPPASIVYRVPQEDEPEFVAIDYKIHVCPFCKGTGTAHAS